MKKDEKIKKVIITEEKVEISKHEMESRILQAVKVLIKMCDL